MRRKVMVLVVALLAWGLAGSSAGARDISADLWGITWQTDAVQLQQRLSQQGFIRQQQGCDQAGHVWQWFDHGVFFALPSGVAVEWQDERLASIHVVAEGLTRAAVNASYQQIKDYLTINYGQPTTVDRYMLKIYPGVWVDTVKWVTTDEQGEIMITVETGVPDEITGAFAPDNQADITITFERMNKS